MIQDINKFTKGLTNSMKAEDVIKALKSRGADQMTCTKAVMSIYKLSLREADKLVQNSIHWKEFYEGNHRLKEMWFKESVDLQNRINKFEAQPMELVGKTIEKVSYFEIDYGTPMFELKDHHSLDYGLQLDMIDGESYYLIWYAQYIQFDLKFAKGKLREELNPESKIGCHNVSSSKAWAECMGQKIKIVKSYWSYVKSLVEPKAYYPQDIQLTFENGKSVIISTIEIHPNGHVNPMADHISVFFDSDTAEKYGARQKL